jgi:hypothetical protein
VRWKGEDRIVPVPGHPDIPSPWVDVVIIEVQKDMSRVYYTPAPGGGSSYVQGQRSKPACWSSNGVRPDDAVPQPVNPVCGTCPKDAWKSGGSPAAPNAKACQQRRRTVLVPYSDDLSNAAEGGPMLLSVPPGSLTNQAAYRELLDEVEDGGKRGLPYFAVITRLSYEQKDAKGQSVKYPKIKFDYIRQDDGRPYYLNDEEAEQIVAMRGSAAVKRILDSNIRDDGPDTDGADGEGSEGGGGGVRAPKPAIPAAPPPPPPPPRATPPTQQSKPVGGHAVTGITEAVNKPATPPPSTRTVATKPKLVPPPVVEDDDSESEAEAHAPLPDASMFDKLMGE